MTDIDAIAQQYTDELDRVYPPMRWTSRWSDGGNIPLGLNFHAAVQEALRVPNYYGGGLWLFSEEGHGHLVPDLDEAAAGWSVFAWTGREAEARLRETLRQAQ